MRWLPGVLALLLSGGLVQHARRPAAEPLEVGLSWGVPRLDSAREQLDYATSRKRWLRGTEGEGRRAARLQAVEAYRAVRRYFPREHGFGAEASFRAGELLRSGREDELAIEEFEQARVLGRESDFGPRAGLEIGHIERRRRRLEAALSVYAAVEVKAGELHGEQRDLAAYWAGRVHARLGRPLDAARCFERAARAGVDPVQRTRAFDAWAETLIDRGDLEGAAGVLEECRRAADPFAQEQTQLGLRVRGALGVMRSVPRLKRAIEARVRRSPTLPPRDAAPRRLRQGRFDP